ncbi:MAG: hypothetical protein JW874_01490 [Spirochaetales bacterium]|nr:hypothetical protein [Spirochaetales bacterium]
MPIIECKNLERLHSEDILIEDAGPLIKAGQKIGGRAEELARHKAGVYKVISLTKEEKDRLLIDDSVEKNIQEKINRRNSGRMHQLRDRLRELLLDLHTPFDEQQSLFSIPGKKSHIEADALLENEVDTLYRLEITAGANRIINKYKYKFITDVLREIYELLDKFKLREKGQREAKGLMPRATMYSIRLNSRYEGERFSMLGDSTVNQAIDTTLCFLYAAINLNKARTAQGAPLSEDRFDPDKHTDANTKYQYKKELLVDAAAGILIHNIGFSHAGIHRLFSAKPVMAEWSNDSKERIRKIQRHINVAKNLVDSLDISSITKMMVNLQRDYPDGTGFPYLNSNKYKHEFLRLFQIIDFYDQMTNPFCCPTVYSRQDVLEYIEKNSGKYIHNSYKFEASPRFDIDLFEEFLNILAMYEPGEKVYLYDRKNRSQHLFVGKVHSYTDSYIPLISILKDEKKNREYKDGQIFFSIPSSEAWLRQDGGLTRQKFNWVKDLIIIDKNLDPGNMNEYEDLFYGKIRPVSKHYK